MLLSTNKLERLHKAQLEAKRTELIPEKADLKGKVDNLFKIPLGVIPIQHLSFSLLDTNATHSFSSI